MVSHLRAVNFRCWERLSVALPEQGGIFVGQNAQGKTSILEAVCVLLRLQSPRTHKMSSMIQMGHAGFGIAGEAWDMERKVRFSASGFACEVDGEVRDRSSAYLRDGGLVVWMGNEDLELVRGGGEVRRRYLDFIGVQWHPEYRLHWSRYRKAVKMKNALLKERSIDARQLEAIEELMIEHGEALAQLRRHMIERLSHLAHESHQAVSGGSERLDLAYRSAGSESLRESLGQAREREWRLRQSVVGPHRDDVVLQLNQLSAAEFASEGQQRTLALALKLAQGALLQEQGRMPIYLLDDIFGELDAQRRNALMSALPSQAQKWITTTTLDWWHQESSTRELALHQVSDGAVVRSDGFR
ncbi:MAG: DNA replication and repair protein RecF [Verrucomicrobia bacterium]|nr:MAG: DNA replication and repair protein RecF [Verrucomicrobiota bacterium]